MVGFVARWHHQMCRAYASVPGRSGTSGQKSFDGTAWPLDDVADRMPKSVKSWTRSHSASAFETGPLTSLPRRPSRRVHVQQRRVTAGRFARGPDERRRRGIRGHTYALDIVLHKVLSIGVTLSAGISAGTPDRDSGG